MKPKEAESARAPNEIRALALRSSGDNQSITPWCSSQDLRRCKHPKTKQPEDHRGEDCRRSNEEQSLADPPQIETTARGRSHERVRSDVIAITAPVANRAARGRANHKWLGSRDIAQ